MRRIGIILFLAVVGFTGWWFWNNHLELKDTIEQYVASGELLTLEARYSADHLMEKHRKELLGDNQHTFKDPSLKFYPYLMIESKYTQPDKKTKEGVVLWGLFDGEMVLDSETWETTRGFEDAINANANRNDYKILLALSRHGGHLSRRQLEEELHLEADIIDPWIESVIDKQLVVEQGSELHLHLEDPKILVIPQTRIKQALVTKPSYQAQRVPRKYSHSQIEKNAQAVFGPTFTIRKVSEVFLPVHCISVLNPDGTVFTTYWNAINGREIGK